MQALDKITILGREIPIKRVTQKELDAVTNDKGCLGCYHLGIIYVARYLTDQTFKRVMLHELGHAVLDITGATALLEDDEEDVICNGFESVLELFKNKQVNKFLAE